jgi:acyl transferase domain-containing protein
MHINSGTPLGDPIEVNALGQALRSAVPSPMRPPLLLGSVKSCYGHTEGAAGVTGVFLAIQPLQTRCHPAVLNMRSMNRYVEAALRDWRKRTMTVGVARQRSAASSLCPTSAAGTSSFGMSGTNAHLQLSVPLPSLKCNPTCAGTWQRTR